MTIAEALPDYYRFMTQYMPIARANLPITQELWMECYLRSIGVIRGG